MQGHTRQRASKMRFVLALLFAGSVSINAWIWHPTPAAAGGWMTWIDPGCYYFNGGGAYAWPGFHWWGQVPWASGSALAQQW